MNLILGLHTPECGQIIISHDLSTVIDHCHKILVMDNGLFVDVFTADQVGGQDFHPLTQQMLQAYHWCSTAKYDHNRPIN